jgi:uncharacterized protein (TIGR03435 family)
MRPTLTYWSLVVVTSLGLVAQPAFEVAVIKANTSSDPESGDIEHGRLTIRNASLRHLIGAAYNVRIDLLKGGPNWVDNDRFDVIAKADPTTSEDISRIMLRTLLAERFRLAVHHEQRLTPVFVLKVARNGPKLQQSAAGTPDRAGCIGSAPLTCHKRSMADLAETLRRHATGIDIPVVDETGLTSRYDFKLFFAATSPASGASPGATEPAVEAPAGVSIFAALREQLGLELQKARRPIDFLIIDHADRVPVEN